MLFEGRLVFEHDHVGRVRQRPANTLKPTSDFEGFTFVLIGPPIFTE